MAISDYPPPLLRDQQGIAEPVPDAGTGVSEHDRLRAARGWSYVCQLYFHEPTARFSIRIRLGAESSDSSAVAGYLGITVTSDADAAQQTLRLRRVEGTLPIAAFELVPLDAEQRAIAFERSDGHDDCAQLSFLSEEPVRLFRVGLKRLDAIRMGALRACVMADAEGIPTCFAHDFQIALDRSERFEIAGLANAADSSPSLSTQLRGLWDTLLSEVPEFLLAIACTFRTDGPLPTSIPVLILPTGLYTSSQLDELGIRLADQLQQWLAMQSPAPGDFALDLSITPLNLPRPLPTLRLRQLLLRTPH